MRSFATLHNTAQHGTTQCPKNSALCFGIAQNVTFSETSLKSVNRFFEKLCKPHLQTMNTEDSPNEQAAVTEGTEVQFTPHFPEEKIIGFNPVTVRARKNTVWFFERMQKHETEHKLGKADAFERALLELLQEQQGTKEQAASAALLQEKLNALEEENQKLLQLTESTAQEPALKDNEHIVTIEPRMLQLLNSIAEMRFANESVRKRWKLEEQETAGQLLLNCITTQEILFNYNACFYTGLTREMFENHAAKNQ